MKERALNEVTPIGMIYKEEIAKAAMTRSALAIFRTNTEIYQGIVKARRKTSPALPHSSLFTIPDIYKSTMDGKRFLLYDGSPVRPELSMDGTFSKTPPNFRQINIIHAVNFDICLPCVFGLLEIASERGKCFSPMLITTDFGSAVLPVLILEFPGSKHMGCFFHFCQAVYRQIQSLGLQQQYTEDETCRCLCRKLMALVLMPTD
ncbi:unnamed protein product [Adineta steineri]|uniref:MULE transposase domain-containing protein n=1 Tax=Adineta steineri TaxID=433720 RepID=A0A814N0A3_9BILA|nr:unnamed protein product [Adineta steineri]CAF1143525.1 unnamed protein product [Adineta steineri]